MRRAVAQHRNLPESSLIALLDDTDDWTVHHAAGSPALPVEQMELLLLLAGL
ncbi:hypothetical protein SK571_36855 [Lentzea sp. BCCO 10_0798]|uniref:Uncharacterized protein n=1 Tax=Lentzea kristufekii TaxID=3095430 RepID=A0ABU4U3Q4_9PSEU|nr:hypothetical protein [Lentzea sp. BCCO 10_0798]MDX8054973.1 hypothetical protein [Lentzea sp. BCCO 10_0798]